MPAEALGYEVVLTFEDGKVTVAALGSTMQLEGDVSEGILTADGLNEDGEATSITFILHEDGTVSCSSLDVVTLYFQVAE